MTDIPVVSPGAMDPAGTVILPAGIRWRALTRKPLVMNPKGCLPAPPDPLVPSLALSVAEDPVGDQDCTITSYIKVTLTVSGLRAQSSGQGSTTPAIWGCYGALIQLAVNSYSLNMKDADFPVITDFEPKLRDLYQGATLDNEVLSGSTGQTTIDRASKSTSSTTLGLTVSGGFGPGAANDERRVPNANASGSISSTRTEEQDYDFSTVSGQSSSQRNATTTSVSQMYNLLTGYHSGTNAIALVMYPRPHIVQPEFGPLSDFTPGLRAMEGIQEVVVVVTRRNDAAAREGLTVTAWMDVIHVSPLLAQAPPAAAVRSHLLPDPRDPTRPLLLHFDTVALRRSLPPAPPGSPDTAPDVAVEFCTLT
jgi:hypothetical protein